MESYQDVLQWFPCLIDEQSLPKIQPVEQLVKTKSCQHKIAFTF